MNTTPVTATAIDVPPRKRICVYPEPFASRMQGRIKRALGDHFGLRQFGVNLTTLQPGACSALYHRHAIEDEFVYILEGTVVLAADAPVIYLEVGTRSTDDVATYPGDDLVASRQDGRWVFTHRDGTPYT